MPSDERERVASRRAPRGAAAVVDEEPGDGALQCTCCTPPNPLVLRPDLGVLSDGNAEYALCVLHQPEPMIYRNRGDGQFVAMPHLILGASGDIHDADGRVIAGLSSDGFRRIDILEDDDPGPGGGGGGTGGDMGPGGGRASRPQTHHVDLTEDDFYRGSRSRSRRP